MKIITPLIILFFCFIISTNVYAKKLTIKAIFNKNINHSYIEAEWEASNPICIELDGDDDGSIWWVPRMKYKTIPLKLDSDIFGKKTFKGKVKSFHSLCRWKLDELRFYYCTNSNNCESIRLFNVYEDKYSKIAKVYLEDLLDTDTLHINYTGRTQINMNFTSVNKNSLSQLIYSLKRSDLQSTISLLKSITPKDSDNIKSEYGYYGTTMDSLHWIPALKGDYNSLEALFKANHKLKSNKLLSHIIFYTAKYNINMPFKRKVIDLLVKYSPDINECGQFFTTLYGYALEQMVSSNTDYILMTLKSHPKIDISKLKCQ